MVRAIAFVVLTAVGLLAPLVYAGPQLASDLQVGDRWTLADDLAIREFKCTRWYFLVSTCDLAYVHRREPNRAGGTLSYLVVGSWAGERALLLRSATDPTRVGTTLGVEHMRQRLVSFGLFVALALTLMAGLIARAVRGPRADKPTPPSADEPGPPGAVVTPPAMPAGPRSFGRRTAGSVG